MVSAGYLDEEDRSNEWYLTGDAGIIVDGRLQVSGRVDEVIVTGGENVDPGDVESVLRSLDGVRDAAVVGLPDDRWGQVVAALVVLDEEMTVGRLRVLVERRLAAFKVPRTWMEADELPRLAVGKVDRLEVIRLLSSAG